MKIAAILAAAAITARAEPVQLEWIYDRALETIHGFEMEVRNIPLTPISYWIRVDLMAVERKNGSEWVQGFINLTDGKWQVRVRAVGMDWMKSGWSNSYYVPIPAPPPIPPMTHIRVSVIAPNGLTISTVVKPLADRQFYRLEPGTSRVQWSDDMTTWTADNAEVVWPGEFRLESELITATPAR